MLVRSALLIIVACLSSSTLVAEQNLQNKINVTFNNNLQECVSIPRHSIQRTADKLLLSVDYKTQQVIGHCSCKSALAHYKVSAHNKELTAGLVEFRNDEELTIPLPYSDSLLRDKQVEITFSCSQPQ
ncbi:DUF2195 family protein [Kangiella shandongensis]|uniref:DUF2195 family protein n=1 Tax=Kangiella shandongensis TaxID=2763258 RepID=UPI001CC08C9B|nr:DUF2195 family protein [Kangiella shandongensis]